MCVIYDCVALEESQKFIEFLTQFFADEKIEKIGHTFSADISYLNKTFGTTFEFAGIVNIENAFKDGNRILGLSKIVFKEFNKKMSKYNQESNWQLRPLRKGQLHYAALDSVSVLYIMKKLKEGGAQRTKNVS